MKLKKICKHKDYRDSLDLLNILGFVKICKKCGHLIIEGEYNEKI